MNKLTPIHQNELNLGFTDFGIVCGDSDDLQGKIFDNSSSKIYLDYDDLIEQPDDEY